jgi:Family of unknown function (DUF5990)
MERHIVRRVRDGKVGEDPLAWTDLRNDLIADPRADLVGVVNAYTHAGRIVAHLPHRAFVEDVKAADYLDCGFPTPHVYLKLEAFAALVDESEAHSEMLNGIRSLVNEIQNRKRYNHGFGGRMKHQIPIRIIVNKPLTGVVMKVQRGRDELLPSAKANDDKLVFDLTLDVDLSGATPNFLGKYAQGPKDARFIYVNSGTYAGQTGTCWSRRAKLSLTNVTARQIAEVVNGNSIVLQTSFPGTGRDGGPTCASVKGIEWKVVKK